MAVPADSHRHDAFVPSLDHLSSPDRKLQGACPDQVTNRIYALCRAAFQCSAPDEDIHRKIFNFRNILRAPSWVDDDMNLGWASALTISPLVGQSPVPSRISQYCRPEGVFTTLGAASVSATLLEKSAAAAPAAKTCPKTGNLCSSRVSGKPHGERQQAGCRLHDGGVLPWLHRDGRKFASHGKPGGGPGTRNVKAGGTPWSTSFGAAMRLRS